MVGLYSVYCAVHGDCYRRAVCYHGRWGSPTPGSSQIVTRASGSKIPKAVWGISLTLCDWFLFKIFLMSFEDLNFFFFQRGTRTMIYFINFFRVISGLFYAIDPCYSALFEDWTHRTVSILLFIVSLLARGTANISWGRVKVARYQITFFSIAVFIFYLFFLLYSMYSFFPCTLYRRKWDCTACSR